MGRPRPESGRRRGQAKERVLGAWAKADRHKALGGEEAIHLAEPRLVRHGVPVSQVRIASVLT